MTSSTFSSDKAGSNGGGIDNGADEVSTNTASVVVTSSTFSGDVASNRGGAIGSGQGSTGTEVSTTPAGDLLVETPSEGACIGTSIDAGYNVSRDTSCAFESGESVYLADLTVEDGEYGDGAGVLAGKGVSLGVTGCTFSSDDANRDRWRDRHRRQRVHGDAEQVDLLERYGGK